MCSMVYVCTMEIATAVDIEVSTKIHTKRLKTKCQNNKENEEEQMSKKMLTALSISSPSLG